MSWNIKFISEENFRTHVEKTIEQYGSKLDPINLKKFNSNVVDPIKIIFDKSVYQYDWDEIIKNEIFRQRDKSSNNDIGYFHQRIFQHFENCSVPDTGWDVIYQDDEGILYDGKERVKKIFVELKNKHNTMNSSSSSKTYIRMQTKLLNDDDCACFLVEVVSKKSQNETWIISVDGNRQQHKRIRKVSIDKFYSIVTGEDNAFYQICMVLPSVIENVLSSRKLKLNPNDTVYDELQRYCQIKFATLDSVYHVTLPVYPVI